MNFNLVVGDITTYKGDVIVNAANEIMLGGAGVDGAIHKAAGPYLLGACASVWEDTDKTPQWGGYDREHGIRCPVGQVRPTPAFNLSSKWVFHTAGPIWPGSNRDPGSDKSSYDAKEQAKKVLRGCYKKAALMAVSMDLKSIAFPTISAGVYGCPMASCASVVCNWAKDYARWDLDVTIYIFNESDLPLWEMMAGKYGLGAS